MLRDYQKAYIEKAQQSIPDGTKVKIDFKDLKWEMLNETDGQYVEEDNGAICTVDSLETYTELGDQDYEYYNLTNIENGKEYYALSGYHLIIQKS